MHYIEQSIKAHIDYVRKTRHKSKILFCEEKKTGNFSRKCKENELPSTVTLSTICFHGKK